MHTFILVGIQICGYQAQILEEAPPDHEKENEADACEGAVLWKTVSGTLYVSWEHVCTHLLDKQLPVDADSRFPVLLAVFPKTAGQLSHAFQAITTVQ